MVCAGWRDPAQQLLLRSLNLRRPECQGFEQLRDVFGKTPHGAFLASCVRSIEVDVGYPNQSCNKSFDPGQLIPILLMFPKLYELDLHSFGKGTHTVIINDLAAVNPSRLPCLRGLKLFARGRGSVLLPQLLSQWPTVRFLTLDVGIYRLHPSIGQIPDLRLWQITYDTTTQLKLLQWLVPEHSLRAFEIRHGDINISELFLMGEGKYLRSLKIPALSHGEWTSYLRVLPLCPNLEELDIVKLSLTGDKSIVVDSLPPKIQYIRIRYVNCAWTDMRDFIRGILRPSLLVISLPTEARDSWQLSLEGKSDWVEFEGECARSKVDIVYTSFDPGANWVSSRFVLCGKLTLGF
jgi:hypothetical protein